jgi:hypothetical protein
MSEYEFRTRAEMEKYLRRAICTEDEAQEILGITGILYSCLGD